MTTHLTAYEWRREREPVATAPRPSAATGRALLATDGSASCVGAVALAAALAAERAVQVRVVSVLDRPFAALRAVTPEPAPVAAREARARLVSRQVALATGNGKAWPLVLSDGSPSALIAGEADTSGADLVIVGLRTHGLAQRVLHDDTITRLLGRIRCPLVAAKADLPGLVDRAVVAADFGASSLAAARAALPLIADGGTLVVVHVEPSVGYGWGSTTTPRAHDASAQLERFVRELDAPPTITVAPAILEGPPYDELASYAATLEAQLLVLGTARAGVAHPLAGRLTGAFVRAAGISLLIAPAAEEAA